MLFGMQGIGECLYMREDWVKSMAQGSVKATAKIFLSTVLHSGFIQHQKKPNPQSMLYFGPKLPKVSFRAASN